MTLNIYEKTTIEVLKKIFINKKDILFAYWYGSKMEKVLSQLDKSEI